MAKLIDTFVDDLPKRSASMESAIERDDLESFAVAVVALRGSSSAIGATQLGRLCADAENLARARDRAAVRSSALNLIRYARSLPEVLRRAAISPN
jgi:HPt (histidine-containing phosphotransfer) domain-containing protein